ncbi:MAG: cation transporter [Candidatus Delongbacteria bacterium]|nr:cation transporter [Candidatus Delongbacteria bacterium]
MKKIVSVVFLATVMLFAGCCTGEKVETVTVNKTVDKSVEKSADIIIEKAEFTVGGSCGMCVNRIENVASKIEGIIKADYDLDKQILKVEFNKGKVEIDTVKKALAAVGHDTDEYKADDEVYNALPGCCHYR